MKIHDINQVSNPCLFRGMSHGSESLKMADHPPPPSSFLLVQQTSAVFMSYLVVRLCGGVEGSGISVVVVNVPHNSTLAALDQRVTPVETRIRMGTNWTSLPALIGIRHQVPGDFWQTIGFQKIENDQSHEDLTDEHEAGEPEQDVTSVEQDLPKSYHQGQQLCVEVLHERHVSKL